MKETRGRIGDVSESLELILGIETSCDETSVAIVDSRMRVLSNVIASQIDVHSRFGGVVPEIASRQHILAVSGITEAALEESGVTVQQIDGIAVTYGPGLSGPLLVGVNFAKGLSMALRRPLFRVNHIEAHILSVWLSTGHTDHGPRLPMVSLVASGGHTELVLVKAPGDYLVLGRTVDDAAGEAYDKVGRLLGLPYPGGPAIERVAMGTDQNARGTVLPRAWMPGTYDFSFSGLKTAVRRLVEAREESEQNAVTKADDWTSEIAGAFQDSVVDVLTAKLQQAVIETGANSASIVGGVAGNQRLRRAAEERLDVPILFPGPGLSADNAAMIAGAALLSPQTAGYELDVDPSLSL